MEDDLATYTVLVVIGIIIIVVIGGILAIASSIWPLIP